MAIVFDRVNKVIEVESPAVEVTIQALLNAIRDFEDDQENMDVAQVGKAAGKDDLGAGVAVAITLELLNDWQLMFEPRGGPGWTQCIVKDGNLVGGIAGNPIKTSAYVQVKLIQSAYGTLTGGAGVWTESEKDNLIAAGEALPAEVWANIDRRLTSRDIDSPAPGESIPSQTQVLEIQGFIDAMKGAGFDTSKESLVKLRELIEATPTAKVGARFAI